MLTVFKNITLFLGINVEKAHLLTTIINNIEMQNNYYQKASLDFVVKESDPLFDRFEEKGTYSFCLSKQFFYFISFYHIIKKIIFK